MDGDLKCRGGEGTSIASKTLIPTETPMGPLCPRLHLRFRGTRSLSWSRRCQRHGLRAQQAKRAFDGCGNVPNPTRALDREQEAPPALMGSHAAQEDHLVEMSQWARKRH